jgi:hypothetical protein
MAAHTALAAAETQAKRARMPPSRAVPGIHQENILTIIKPTVGRKVWYWPSANDNGVQLQGQPWDATIIGVHSDNRVNIRVTDSIGYTSGKQFVHLLQGEEKATGGGYCQWMPYQVGQVKAQEASSPKVGINETTGKAVTLAELQPATIENPAQAWGTSLDAVGGETCKATAEVLTAWPNNDG